MNAAWALCILLAAPLDNAAPPPPPEPVSLLIPESLTRLLTQHPELRVHHQGYLQELAKRPDLAETETAWWQASSTPALRNLAARFEDALASDNTAQYRFSVFYDALARSAELRKAVENLVRVELENARLKPELAEPLQFLRANPDIALRYLRDPDAVRPRPEALEATHSQFVEEADWRGALFDAYDAVALTPDAHLVVFPWWRQLAELTAPDEKSNLDAALYQQPHQYWLWHLRNMNLANNQQAAPWIRYWQRLIQREPELARTYGPFITKLFADPEQLRQHLIDLTTEAGDQKPDWPPPTSPPGLPPLVIDDPVESMRESIQRPTIERPDRPDVQRPPRPDGPKPPNRPTAPNRPTISPAER